MIRNSTSARWLLSAFLLGIALGGLGGWQAARRGGPARGKPGEPANSGLIASGNGDDGSRSRTPAVKFAPTGDPAEDFHRIQRLRDAASRTSAFRQLLNSLSPEAMVKTDPEGTFRWLRGLKADFTDDVAHDALQTLSHYDGVKAGQLLAQNGDLRKAPEFVTAMTAGWARTEPDKALAWALELPSNIAAGGIKTAAGALAEKNFAAALTTLSDLEGEQRAAALNGVSSAAGGPHLKELLPLVEALPESADRASAVASLMNSWVDKSPEEAGTWLAAQPAGASRDQGAIVLALKSMENDPESSLDWAASISAQDQRDQGVDGLLDAWLKKDPKSARAWVQQSDRLSEADRTRLLEKTGR